MNTAPTDPRPVKIRWWILLMLFLAMTINMLDRQVLSIVAPVLREQLHFSNTAYGTIVFFFLLGMMLGQIPVGILIDRYGARMGFNVIVAFWSVANMLHAAARSVTQLAILRFFLGTGECGTYSGGVKVIAQWFPTRERAFASGLFNCGSLVGAVFAPPLIVWLMLHYGWPSAFLLPGAMGLLWLIPWAKIYWEPGRHPGLSPEERAQFQVTATAQSAASAVPFKLLLRLTPVWGLILMRAFGGPVTHFYWYWLPEYLKHARNMSLEDIGLFAWLPFFSGGLGNIGGGWLSSYLIRHGWTVDRARKTVVAGGTVLCLFAVLVPWASSTALALTLITVASFGINAIAANLMGLLGDMFPPGMLGRVSALTGVGDNCTGMVMMLLTGIVVDHFSYLPVFIAAGLFPVVTLLALLFLVGEVRPILSGAPASPTPPAPLPQFH